MPIKAGQEQHKQTSLQGIARTASYKAAHRFRNLYGEIDYALLKMAWDRLDKKSMVSDKDLTIRDYAEHLEDNLLNLLERLKAKSYKARLITRHYIPKDNGKKRPLGIPTLEDKIVQKAAAMLLEAIYEQDFKDSSYGYRVKRSAKDAVNDLTFNLQYGKFGYIVEADIKGFFDNIDHDLLLEMLSKRINDRAFLHLIRKWLKAGVLEPDGVVIHPNSGTPQGGIISPILANIYLHEVLDSWFEDVVKPELKGKAIIYRYADDFVCAFQYKKDVDRFFRTLPKRMVKYGLELEESKTSVLRFSRFHPSRQRTFHFLGFEFYWFPDRKGISRVQRRTSPKKQRAAFKRIKDWIKKARHLPKKKFFSTLKRKLTGHYNYYYVRGNSRSVYSFYGYVKYSVFKWLNRRSQRKSYNWKQFERLLKWVNIVRPKLKIVNRRSQVVL
jgi:group II intron reverse transcriptase/maturase